MTERKPQLAYAPISPKGLMAPSNIRETRLAASETIGRRFRDGWSTAHELGWRIARVRIELDEEKSSE
jgi:hypothetical protein